MCPRGHTHTNTDTIRQTDRPTDRPLKIRAGVLVTTTV